MNSQYNPFRGCLSLLSLELPEGLEIIQLFHELSKLSRGIYTCEVLVCPSLVNLYLPVTEQLVVSSSNEPIPEDYQFSKVARNWRDLVTKLQHRFDAFPLHKICYFHSYHPLDDTLLQMRSILMVDNQSPIQVDVFGMTPLHILALAQTSRLELFQELLTSVHAPMTTKDGFGSTPLDYLGKNLSEEGLQTTDSMGDASDSSETRRLRLYFGMLGILEFHYWRSNTTCIAKKSFVYNVLLYSV